MAVKLGIIAGGGELPARMVEVCRANGRAVFVLAFTGQTDPATVVGVDHAWVRLGQTAPALAALRDAEVEELVLIGPVKRPGLKGIGFDLRGAKFLAKVAAQGLGDDGLLSAAIRGLEDEGFRVIGAAEVLAELLAPRGPIGAGRPDAQAERDIARGLEVLRALQGIVLGVEADEGTDGLIARCAGLAREGPGGVLVKIRKPGQERRVDLPTLGAETVARARRAGLRGIAVEAGGSLIVDRAAVAAAADAAGIFLCGIEVPAQPR
jgi:DUF1009 family protein